MKKVTEIIEQIEKNKADLEFLPTGFYGLDQFLDGGFMRKELVILGAGTGIGKSYIASQMMYNIAKKGFKTAYFSLELANETIVARLLGAISNIKPTRIMAGLLTKEEFDEKTKAKANLQLYEEYMNFYDDVYELSEIIKLIKENKYEAVCIDFIQNVFSAGADENLRLAKAALELQRTAKEVNCCILLLSQLSNQIAREGFRAPVIEYRGSGAIAHVADLGFIVERTDPEGSTNEIKLNLKKNRRGVSGVYFNLLFKHPGGWIV